MFATIADPVSHAAIDGTGWVREPPDRQPLTASGQIFRMGMYSTEHPDGAYQTVNKVEVLDPLRAIGWLTGFEKDDGELEFGGWIWRYDLTQLGPDETKVTLSYDWSAVGPVPRQHIQFPPFPPDHLDNSLSHLAAIVAS